MLNKNNLRIGKLSADEAYGHAIDCISICAGETISTDGHLLMRIERPASDEDQQSSVRIDAGQALIIAKTVHKHDPLTLSVEGKKAKIHAPLMTFETSVDEREFPNADAVGVIPKLEEVQASVVVNVDLLISIISQIRRMGSHDTTVCIRLSGEERAVRFDFMVGDSQRGLAVLMPMRGNRNDYRYPIFDGEPKVKKEDE